MDDMEENQEDAAADVAALDTRSRRSSLLREPSEWRVIDELKNESNGDRILQEYGIPTVLISGLPRVPTSTNGEVHRGDRANIRRR